MSSEERAKPTDYTDNPANFGKYVIAVIDSREEARQAAEALHTAGFASGDIVLSPEVKRNARPLQESEGMEHSLAEPPQPSEELFTEEGIDQELYATERARGHVVIRVQTASSSDVEPARAVLARYHARDIRHVGTWTRETLSNDPYRA